MSSTQQQPLHAPIDVVVMAAGKGTRFGTSPKCVQPVRNVPLARHSINAFRRVQRTVKMTRWGGDCYIFATMALSSFASGALITTQGWTWLNWGSLVPLSFCALGLLYLARHKRMQTRMQMQEI